MSRWIDADQVTDKIRQAIKESESPWNHYGWFQKIIDESPTVEPKKGHWRGFHMTLCDYACSECLYCITEYEKQAFSFCPYCGADMRNEDDSN